MAGERPRGLKASRLMIPGPVDVDPSVLAQMALPQIAHYSEEAVACYHRCAEALRVVVGCHHGQDVFIMNGSGNVAVDAAAASIIRGGCRQPDEGQSGNGCAPEGSAHRSPAIGLGNESHSVRGVLRRVGPGFSPSWPCIHLTAADRTGIGRAKRREVFGDRRWE